MFTSGIGMFCLKPIKFLLNIIEKYNLQNKISTTTLRPLIEIFIVSKRLSINRHFTKSPTINRLIIHRCQPYIIRLQMFESILVNVVRLLAGGQHTSMQNVAHTYTYVLSKREDICLKDIKTQVTTVVCCVVSVLCITIPNI